MAAIKFGIAERPPGASIAQIYGIAVLTGVGFTMSLFIGTLAFEDEALMAQVRLGVLFAYLIHGVHHAFPEDRRRWLMPPVVTVPVAIGLFLALRLLIGTASLPVFAGALFGYLAYDLLHYASHAGALRGRVPRYLRQHHLTHHYRIPESRFGVSSPLWDRVFGTLR